MIRFIILCAFLFPSICIGNVENDLDGYFKSLGYSSNTSKPEIYQGQQGGYYTGGSISLRSGNKVVQPVQITLPSYRGGCGGIDFFGGSVSLLNSDELKAAFKTVLNNSVNVAMTLVLDTVSPMIAKNGEWWKEWVDKVNRFNINSCEMAQNLVGGTWSKIKGAAQQNCQNLGMESNMFSNFTQAKQGCGIEYNDQTEQKLENSKDPYNYSDLKFENSNVAWKAIKKIEFLNGDIELSSFFMSLSGTIVLKDKKITPYPPIAAQNETLDVLLNGGEITILMCDEKEKCLNPTAKKIKIDEKKSFKYQISEKLRNIATKVKFDKDALNDEEKKLIASTTLPILKLIVVNTAYLKSSSLPNIDIYAEIIANDILYQYLEDCIQIIQFSLSALPIPKEIYQTILDNTNVSINALRNKQILNNKSLDTRLQLITQSQQIEKVLLGEFSSDLSATLTWSRGLQ